MSNSSLSKYIVGGVTSLGLGLLLTYKFNEKKSYNINDFKIKNKGEELPKDIDKYLSISLKAALEAGELVKKYINNREAKLGGKNLTTKSSSADFVTVIDKESEKLILSYINKHFPNDDIIAEESYNNKNDEYNINDNKVTFCIDPIDGTTNFFYGLPTTAICIGIRYKGKSVMGIVHCPILNETFFGVLNNGSYVFRNNNIKNRIKLTTNNYTNKDSIKDILILTEVGYDRSEVVSKSFGNRIYSVLGIEKVRGVRCLGSCAINMCYVASGRADIFYEGIDKKRGPKPWDFTAPEVIALEAGAYITRTNGDNFDCTKGNIICASSKLLNQYFVDKKYALSI